MKFKKLLLLSLFVGTLFLSGCATEKVILNSKGDIIGYHHKDGTYEYLEGYDENGHPIQNDEGETEVADNDSGNIVNNEKDSVEEDESLGLKEKYDTAQQIKKIVEASIKIKNGKGRAVLGKGIKSALVSAAVSSVYDEKPTSYLEDDTYFVSLGEYFSLDAGTLAQFELGKQNNNGIVQDGDYAAYSLDNFIFVLGEAKDGVMTGWYLVYDQMTMELYMKNAETGQTLQFIEADSDDTLFYDSSTSDNGIEEYGIVKTFKDGDKQWRVNMENGNVEYTHGDNFFTGNEYAFDATFGGHNVSYRMFCGATYDAEGSLDSPYVDLNQFGTNMMSIINNLNPSELTEVEELISDIGGSAIASIPVLDIMDTLTNGSVSEGLANEISKIFKDKHKAENKMSTYERALWNEKQKMKSARYYNYNAGQIKGEVDTSVVSNDEAERLGSMSVTDRITEEREQKLEKERKENEEAVQRVLEEREQKEAERKKQNEEALQKVLEERERLKREHGMSD